MAIGIAKRAKAIKPSPTLDMAAKAKAMKAQGIDVVDFGLGEPDFDTPENVKQAGIKAIQSGFTKYSPAGGTDELKDAVVEKLTPKTTRRSVCSITTATSDSRAPATRLPGWPWAMC